jgi:murein L,D-transpeptidase YcbB/YkuD
MCTNNLLKSTFLAVGVSLAAFAVSPAMAEDGWDNPFGGDSPDLRAALHNVAGAKDSSLASVAEAVGLYQDRDYRPIWIGDGEGAQDAGEVRNTLAHADRQGLRAEDYISQALQAGKAPKSGKGAAEFDFALTEALLRYAHDVRVGIPPHDAYTDVRLPILEFDAAAALKRALRAHAVHTYLAALPPAREEYRQLVTALAFYRNVASKGGWPTLKGGGEISLEGNDSRVATLAKRLALEDPVLAGGAEASDAGIVDAIVRFQNRNGLNADGRIGHDTVAALNVPASVRADEIRANLERWRWMSFAFEHRYIEVNIPDQSLDFMVDGHSVLHSKVVVGKKTTPSPITRMMAEAVIANPPWTIPSDIAARMVLPHLKHGSKYLASKGMVLVDRPDGGDPNGSDIDWRNVSKSGFNYQIVQNPGPDSALGVLMLDSPNDFGVYLHDTPKKKLFDLTDREASNGCIRVQAIYPLASWALANDPMAASDQLDSAIGSHETQTLKLDEPLPIYVLYWTAVPQDDGTVGFRPDLYGRDRRLLAAMASRREHPARQISAMLDSPSETADAN